MACTRGTVYGLSWCLLSLICCCSHIRFCHLDVTAPSKLSHVVNRQLRIIYHSPIQFVGIIPQWKVISPLTRVLWPWFEPARVPEDKWMTPERKRRTNPCVWPPQHKINIISWSVKTPIQALYNLQLNIMAVLVLKKQRWEHSCFYRTVWRWGASSLMKRWVGVGCGRCSAANNVPLSPLRLGCHTLLWSLLTHRRPMSCTISPGLPFIGCCASSDRSSLLNDNRQQLHTLTHTFLHTTVLQENKCILYPPFRILPWLFLCRKEDKYPHSRKKPAPDAFSTVHCFN